MLIIMQTDAKKEQIDQVISKVKTLGFEAHTSSGEQRTVIGVVGKDPFTTQDHFLRMPGVDRIMYPSRVLTNSPRANSFQTIPSFQWTGLILADQASSSSLAPALWKTAA